MIVLDGTPGAGKTTLLGRMLEATADRLVIFPEAQPPRSVTDDAVVAHRLLVEDLARAKAAARLTTARPDLIVASDRCHLGVLAYRHALRRTGRATCQALDHAVDLCQTLRLADAHHGDTIVVLLLDPHESIHRRAAFAHDRRYATWYDPDFLTAYNEAMADLAPTIAAGSTVTIHDTTRDGAIPPALAQLAAAPPSQPPPATLTCRCGCPEPRSGTVTTPAGPTQLYASSIHVQRPDRVACLRSAADIEAAFRRR